MSAIRVTTLGPLTITRDGAPVRDLPDQPVRCALFVYPLQTGRAVPDGAAPRAPVDPASP